MKRMKKFMSALSLIVMAFVCALAFAGCGATDEFARAESATIEEIEESLDARTEVGLGNGFDMTLTTNMNIMGVKLSVNARIKILFEGTSVTKAIFIMSMSGHGESLKIYAYVKDEKLYTRTTGKEGGHKIDTKYVSDFDGDFGMGSEYDVDGLKEQLQDAIDKIIDTLTNSPTEVLEAMGLKKIVDEENDTARFQIKADYTETDAETGELVKLGSYTFVLGFEGNELVEISASTKMSGINISTKIHTLSEIADSEYPSETELSKYVSSTL